MLSTSMIGLHDRQEFSLFSLLAAQAASNPDAIALLAPGRPPLTYGCLWRHLDETAQTLRTMGISRQDRVALVLPQGPEMAVSFLAVAGSAICAPLNPAMRTREFDMYLSDLPATAVLVQAGLDSPAREVARARGTPLIHLTPLVEAEAGMFTLTSEAEPSAGHPVPAQPDDVALVLYTSGTASQPKRVPLTQRNLCVSAHNHITTLRLSAGDRCVNVMPLFHIHGLVSVLLASLLAGASVVCPPDFSAPQFFALLDQFRPTWYTAAPTLHQAVLAHAAYHREILKRCPLRFVRSAAAPLPPKTMIGLERTFNAPVIQAYGMTEASAQITSNPLPPQPRKAGSVGVPAGPEVVIMDKAGQILPAGIGGELCIRGASIMQGYDNNPAANAQAFRHGWLRTGDQGYIAPDGYVFITGRLNEMINRGGEKITPREVEDALMAHPAVAQAVTFAVPHTHLGEDVAAAVVLHASSVATTEHELRTFVAAHLVDFKVPRRVLIVEDLPKSSTGKLQRWGLVERLGLTAIMQEEPGVRTAHTTARTPIEKILAYIWAEVLGVKHVGVHDNFFKLGGHSLLATQIASRLHDIFRVALSLHSFFDAPTVARMAAVIAQQHPDQRAQADVESVLAEIEGLSKDDVQRRLNDGQGSISQD